jgi:hypothetical protein
MEVTDNPLKFYIYQGHLHPLLEYPPRQTCLGRESNPGRQHYSKELFDAVAIRNPYTYSTLYSFYFYNRYQKRSSEKSY